MTIIKRSNFSLIILVVQKVANMKFFSALLLLCALVGFIATASAQSSSPAAPEPAPPTSADPTAPDSTTSAPEATPCCGKKMYFFY